MQKLERTELWKTLQDASASSSVIYLTTLPEDVTTQDRQERESIARRIEAKLRSAPSLEFYSRVGMYDFVGVSSTTVDGLLDWFGGCTDTRCGLAAVGIDGLAVTEKLMVGTSGASRQNREKFAFRMVDDWVVPAE
jgi:hypothetical protein